MGRKYCLKEPTEQQAAYDAGKSEFCKDIREMLARDDVQSRQDICKLAYRKAQDLLQNPTDESIHQAYDIMGSLASQFDFIPAIMWMGDFTENVLQDAVQAVFWYKKAADLGDGNGARCYADMLMTGNGVQRDVQQAMVYYKAAADKGVPEAAFVLGEYFRNAGDNDSALDAYQKAYDGGYTPAEIRINQIKNAGGEKINKEQPNCDNDNVSQKNTEDKDIISAMDFLERFLSSGSGSGQGNSSTGFPNIPEIMVQANIVCTTVFLELGKEINDERKVFYIAPMWCAYAGIGAAAEWYENWDALKAKGIIPSLTAARGYFAMDEYVMDYTGIMWGSEESNTLRNTLQDFSVHIVDVFKGCDNPAQYMEGLKAMYYYGMIYEMKRLGLN